MKKNVAGTLLGLAATGAVVAGASFALYKVMKKHLKFSVEILPDGIEEESDLTAAVDVVDINDSDEKEEDFEISFIDEGDDEEEAAKENE